MAEPDLDPNGYESSTREFHFALISRLKQASSSLPVPEPKWVETFTAKRAYSSEFQKGGAVEGIRTPIYQ
jgi:hypothetical protein